MSLLSHLHSSTQIINQFLPNLALLCSTIRPNGQTYRLACLLVKPDTAISQAAPPGNLGHPLQPVTVPNDYKPKPPYPSTLNAWVVGLQKRPANGKKKFLWSRTNWCLGWGDTSQPRSEERRPPRCQDAKTPILQMGLGPITSLFLWLMMQLLCISFLCFFFSNTRTPHIWIHPSYEGRP